MKEADKNLEEVRATFIAEYGELGQALLEHTQNDIEEARCAIESRYQGEYELLKDFAFDYVRSQCNLPDDVLLSFDWDQVVQRLFAGQFSTGDFFCIPADDLLQVFGQDDRISPLKRVHKNSRKARAFIAKYGRLGQALLEHTQYVLEKAQCLIEERYRGCYSSKEDFARHYVSNWSRILDDLRDCIECGFYLKRYLFGSREAPFFSITVDDQVHVFSREEEESR